MWLTPILDTDGMGKNRLLLKGCQYLQPDHSIATGDILIGGGEIVAVGDVADARAAGGGEEGGGDEGGGGEEQQGEEEF